MRGRPSWPFLAVLPLLVGMSASCGPATKIRPAPPEVSMRFDELAVLGGDLDGPAEELLGRPAAVRTDRAGNVYVADRGSMTVRVFDTQGRFLRAFGGRGRGRGEFLEITCLEVTSDGELIVADGLGLRLTRFGAGESRLHDLSVDPAQRDDLASARGADVARLLSLLDARSDLSALQSVAESEIDPETAERLRSLGYLR